VQIALHFLDDAGPHQSFDWRKEVLSLEGPSALDTTIDKHDEDQHETHDKQDNTLTSWSVKEEVCTPSRANSMGRASKVKL
jgi:hypothetical protein